ncbi:MAG: CHAP domain-containing protein [Oscillospiraceae bacterium]|jgi:hypothetical protein|nr:CHAP domain-containing protein [Oscillospiraceae bacterium]
MSTQIDDILAIAQAELGYVEKKSNSQLDSKTANAGSGNFTKYWRDLKPSFQGQPWCYCFVSWAARTAGVPESILPTCYSCSEGVAWFKARGQWVERTMAAKPGDLVFFKDSAGRTAHIGLVYKADRLVHTYEGNASSAAGVTPNGGSVVAKSYEPVYNRIIGYARPKYEVKQEDDIVTQDQFEAMYAAMAAKWDKLGASDRMAPEEYADAVRAGVSDGTRPQAPATRQEVAVMAYRAARQTGG